MAKKTENNSTGFSCPTCSRHDTKVTGGERRGQVRIRFRKCPCGHSFSTMETSKHTRHTALAEAVDTLNSLSDILMDVKKRVESQLAYIENLYGDGSK